MRTPVAWKNLTSSLSKCALAATGVGFAVMLMFMQIGFRNALIDNNVQLLTLFDPNVASITIVSRARYNISTEQRFPRRLLEQAASLPEVAATCSVSVERGTASVKVAGKTAKPIRVIAIELGQPQFFADDQLYQKLAIADESRSALVDNRSKAYYGFASDLVTLQSQKIELNGQAIAVSDRFQLGTDFANDGSLMLSEHEHRNFFPYRSPTGNPSDMVDLGLVHTPGLTPAEIGKIAAKIESIAPEQIQAWPTTAIKRREQEFWANNTPIGKIFLIGTIMGLVVGAIICYQIQFTDIAEHMSEFATLKAMGYGPGYFWSLILCQSLYLAFLGFVPGLIASLGLYQLLAESSGLTMTMTLTRVAFVWGLTVLMCVISGMLAIRKLFGNDPASLF